MWRQAKVTIGGTTADQAMVDFAASVPAVVEWPSPVPLNTPVKIGSETRYAAEAQACAGQFHIPLMAAERKPEAKTKGAKQ